MATGVYGEDCQCLIEMNWRKTKELLEMSKATFDDSIACHFTIHNVLVSEKVLMEQVLRLSPLFLR